MKKILTLERHFKTTHPWKTNRKSRTSQSFKLRAQNKKKFVSKRQRRKGMNDFKRKKLQVYITSETKTPGNRRSSVKVSFRSARSPLASRL